MFEKRNNSVGSFPMALAAPPQCKGGDDDYDTFGSGINFVKECENIKMLLLAC